MWVAPEPNCWASSWSSSSPSFRPPSCTCLPSSAGGSGRCPFPCQMPPAEFGSVTHSSPGSRRHSVQLTPSHTWYFAQTPDNHSRPSPPTHTPTWRGTNYTYQRELPSCLEWYLQGLQVLSSHYVCSITCVPPLNTHRPPLCLPVCTTIPPIGWLPFPLLNGRFVAWKKCVCRGGGG